MNWNAPHHYIWGSPGGLDSKESACNIGDTGSIPGSGRSPGEWNGNPLHYSCLVNPMDRGTWQATVHGSQRVGHNWVTNTVTFFHLYTHTHTHTHTYICNSYLHWLPGKPMFVPSTVKWPQYSFKFFLQVPKQSFLNASICLHMICKCMSQFFAICWYYWF